MAKTADMVTFNHFALPIETSGASLQKGIPPDISEGMVLEVEVKMVHTRLSNVGAGISVVDIGRTRRREVARAV